MDSSGLDGLTVFPQGRVLEKAEGERREMGGGTGVKGGGAEGKQWLKEERAQC